MYEEDPPVVEHVMSTSVLQAYLAAAWNDGFTAKEMNWDQKDNPFWQDEAK